MLEWDHYMCVNFPNATNISTTSANFEKKDKNVSVTSFALWYSHDVNCSCIFYPVINVLN